MIILEDIARTAAVAFSSALTFPLLLATIILVFGTNYRIKYRYPLAALCFLGFLFAGWLIRWGIA